MHPMSPPEPVTSAPVPPDVTDVTIDRPASELRLEFDDGVSGAITLLELRTHCPCATCRAARQSDRPVWVSQGGENPSVRDAELIGAWGLGITWDDGHATGIYPFSSLHEWLVAGKPRFTPDSGLAG
jgi:DUF971 family protein